MSLRHPFLSTVTFCEEPDVTHFVKKISQGIHQLLRSTCRMETAIACHSCWTERILHQFPLSLSRYVHSISVWMDSIHPRWCKISSINSIANWSSVLMRAILSCSHEIYKYRNYVSIVNSVTCYIVRSQQPNTQLRKPSTISLLKTKILSPPSTITTFQHTVDGRSPAPPGMYKTL